MHTIDLTNPYAICRQFVTDEVLDIIVIDINRYAAQYISSHQLRPRSIYGQWQDSDRNEIKHFLAILFIMGINYQKFDTIG